MPSHRLSVSIKRAYEPASERAGIGMLAAAGPVTLVFAARVADHSHAAILRNLPLRSAD